MASDGLLETDFDLVVRLVAEEWPFISRDYFVDSSAKVDRWDQCSELYPFVSRLAQVYLSQAKGSMASDVDFVELLTETAWFRYEMADPDAATRPQDLALSICQRLPGDKNTQPSDIHAGELWVAAQKRDFRKVFHHAMIRFKIEEDLYHETGTATLKTALAHNDLAIHDRETIFGLNDREFIRTGALYYALVRNSQGLLFGANTYHGRALLQFEILGNLNRIINYLQKSSSRPPRTPPSHFLAARLNRLLGSNVEADNMLQKSVMIYNEINPHDGRTAESLGEDDIENLFR
ncbi:hypothetical protein MMC29_004623, partial [Sticta canariensis]|nr:hypothetical protein [Sticta canariensis]